MTILGALKHLYIRVIIPMLNINRIFYGNIYLLAEAITKFFAISYVMAHNKHGLDFLMGFLIYATKYKNASQFNK